MNTQKLLDEAKQHDMKVEMSNGKLKVEFPKGPVPEFVKVLRAHKVELLNWFATQSLIRQIQCGEFADCDRKTAQKIISILQASRHPLASRALEHLLHDA